MNVALISLALAVFLLLPESVRPQTISGRFSTSVYAFERFDTVNSSAVIARGYQTALLDVTQGNISLHTSFYGATSISQPSGNDAVIRVNNLFLRWSNITRTLELSVGRIPVFAGVGNGIVDGLELRARGMGDALTISGYGGANVRAGLQSTGMSNLDKNYLAGGQLIAHVFQESRIGISYVNRRIEREPYAALRPDSSFNPVSFLVTPDSRAEQAFGIDVRSSESRIVTVYGRYDYDLNLKRSRRLEAGARAAASGRLAFTAGYVYREPRLFYNSYFTLFPAAPTREYEGGAEYQVLPSVLAFARFAYVQYENDMSRRLTVGFNHDYGSLLYAGTNGFAGQLSSLNAQAMVPFLERRVVPTVGVSFAAFRLDEDQNKREDIFTGILGVIVRPLPAVSGDVQVQWLHTTLFEHDVRLLAKISYWFNHHLHLFGDPGAPE